MAPYTYESYRNPYVLPISDLIAREGDIAAASAQRLGDIYARQAESNGSIWGRAIEGIGQTVANVPQQIQQMQRAQLEQRNIQSQIADRAAQEQERQQKLASAQRQQQLTAQVDGLMQHALKTDPDTGISTFDRGTFEQGLIQSNLGHLYPQYAEQLDKMDESARKLNGEKRTLYARAIYGVQQAGNTPEAVATAAAYLKKNGALDDEHLQTILGGVSQDPSVQHIGDMMSTIAQGLPEYRDLVNAEEKRKADLAKSTADTAKLTAEAQKAQAEAKNLDTYGRPTAGTPQEQELDAFARSLGKPSAAALTYQERQQFTQNQVNLTSAQALKQHMAERQFDINNPIPEKVASQDKLEQEYRTVLARGLSSRSGGLGLEDAKVQQANHLLALLDQAYDPKTGTYNIPKMQQGELAAGLARLVAPGGNVGIEMMREFDQRTAKGDLAGALSYVTGTPWPSATQDLAKLLKDSIQRQGSVAEQNREGEMAYLRGLAPTGLEEPRRQALEATTLNPLRQSRVIRNSKTGETRLQVSVDGGKTWR